MNILQQSYSFQNKILPVVKYNNLNKLILYLLLIVLVICEFLIFYDAWLSIKLFTIDFTKLYELEKN